MTTAVLPSAETPSLMSSLALIGPGAVGCTLLAHLGRAGARRILVAARTPFAQLEVETPEGLVTAQPEMLVAPPEEPIACDWVLLTTKTYDVEGALPWLDCFVGPATRIAIIQNGVEHLDRLPPRFPRATLVPVVIDCPAERRGPGRARQRGPALATVPDDEAGRAFVALFAGTPVQARVSADWKTVAWRKLCLNAVGAVSAVTLQPAGVAHLESVAGVMRGIVREVVAVGRAEGARLEEGIVEEVIAHCLQAPRDAINSILADRLAGRPMESEARNGVVVRFGRKHGLPTPYNETVSACLSAVERGAGGLG